MTEQECLQLMKAPGQLRPSKPYLGGVIQIHITRSCDKSCFGCTQGSNLAGPVTVMTPEQFELAIQSLGFQKGDGLKHGKLPDDRYFGVVGVFGGNPALSPFFGDYCETLKDYVPFEQRGLWCNHPRGKGKVMATTFNPAFSNLNVHMDQEAYDQFKRDWPSSRPFGLHDDSRHSPPFVAMKDVVLNEPEQGGGVDEGKIYELISNCDINQHWSAMIGVFRGELRAWFCEVAGAQAMLHQHEEDYPDTGIDPTDHAFSYLTDIQTTSVTNRWWKLPMSSFKEQVRKHCFDCGVPLRGYGELAQSDRVERGYDDPIPKEQTSATHAGIYKPKRTSRKVEVVTDLVQLGIGKIERSTHYLQNARV